MGSKNNKNCFLIIFLYLISRHEALSFKCLWEKVNLGDWKTKQLPMTTDLMQFSPNIDSTNSVCENKKIRKVATAGYKTNNVDEKKKKNISSVKSLEKNISLQLNNNITQAEEARNISFQTYVNITAFGIHSINYLTHRTFLQISAAEMILILFLLISTRYYVLNLDVRDRIKDTTMDYSYPERDEGIGSNVSDDIRNPERDKELVSNVCDDAKNPERDKEIGSNVCDDVKNPERDKEIRSNVSDDVINPERDEEIGSNVSDDVRNPERDEEIGSNFSNNVRYPERVEEIASNFGNDELAWITSSSMVYSHLQNLANEIKTSKPDENSEKYLTLEFLQTISDRIAEDGFMRSNFQNLLTAERLLLLGRYNYRRNRNSVFTEQASSNSESNEIVTQLYAENLRGTSHLESDEIVTQRYPVNLQDVRMNLDLKVGDQEFKIVL